MDYQDIKDVTNKEDLKFLYVYEQGYDQSCGFSSLSSLLDIYWHIKTNEKALIEKYIKKSVSDDDMLTVSFLDLKKAIEDKGLYSKGFKMDFNNLKKLDESYYPIIVHYNKPDDHFALLLCIKDKYLITADPARGIEILQKNAFLKRYSGNVLLLASEDNESDKRLLNSIVKKELLKKEYLEELS